ncbi:MAG: glycosyltransferase family 2 protein [Cyanobacteria bacterium P01_H01_bin.121]
MTTLKTGLQQTLEFVNYHLNLPVDHMFLFFDDPTDPAIDLLLHAERLTCVRCDQQHWQRLGGRPLVSAERQYANADLAWAWAREQHFDWFMHFDSDELLYLEDSWAAVWAEANSDTPVIRWLPLEAVPEQEAYQSVFREVSLFKAQVGEQPLKAAAAAGLNLPSYEDYFRAHLMGKSTTRTTAQIAHVRSHAPRDAANKKLPTVISSQAYILHFDCCDYDSWLAKWTSQYNQQANPRMRPGRRRIYEEFRAVYEQQDPELLHQLYRQQFFIAADDQSILQSHGLLRHISLPPQAFATVA